MTIERKIISKKRKNTSNKIGAAFEKKLTKMFDYYIENDLAYITKIPTEFTIIRGSGGRIVNCIAREKSKSLDYEGVLSTGKFISFEAKTYNADNGDKTPKPFPLDNIKEYQYSLCDTLLKYTNKVFFIIECRFNDRSEVYMIHCSKIKEFKESNSRKSIPYETLKTIGVLVENMDIIKYIDQI